MEASAKECPPALVKAHEKVMGNHKSGFGRHRDDLGTSTTPQKITTEYSCKLRTNPWHFPHQLLLLSS